jgi:hypothetical protein
VVFGAEDDVAVADFPRSERLSMLPGVADEKRSTLPEDWIFSRMLSRLLSVESSEFVYKRKASSYGKE